MGEQLTQVFDVGGTITKYALCDDAGTLTGIGQSPTTYPLSPRQMIRLITSLADAGPGASRVAIGFPGMVRGDIIYSAPHFIRAGGPGTAVDPDLRSAWARFPLATELSSALRRPAMVANDADMHGLAFIHGAGIEIMIAFGTGVGTAVYRDGRVLQPHLELGQYPFLGAGSLDEFAGDRALRDAGEAEWTRRAALAVREIRNLVFADRVFLGGGNSRFLAHLRDEQTVVVGNLDGMRGGPKLWAQT